MSHNKKEQKEDTTQEENMEAAEKVREAEEEAREPQEITITDIELEKLKQEAGEFRQKYLHLLADAENIRKRLQKDRDEIVQQAIKSIILDFLHPIDHMENALKFTEEATDEVKHWATGFKMILDQFKDSLARSGVKPFESIGKEFDPHLHDAVEMVETDQYPPGIVVEENIRGYTIGDRTLRPARVKVAKASSEKEASESADDNAEENKN